MKRKTKNPRVGRSFEDYLDEEGDLQEATALAVKRVLAWELSRAMKKANMKSVFACLAEHQSRREHNKACSTPYTIAASTLQRRIMQSSVGVFWIQLRTKHVDTGI